MGSRIGVTAVLLSAAIINDTDRTQHVVCLP